MDVVKVEEMEKRIKKLEERVSSWEELMLAIDKYIKNPDILRQMVKQEMVPFLEMIQELGSAANRLEAKQDELIKKMNPSGLLDLPGKGEGEKPS